MNKAAAVIAGIAAAIGGAITLDLHTAITRWLWSLP